jgi:hypothetical protein
MAWGLDDVLKLLDRWGEWKRMREAPARLDELEKRVAAAENLLAGKAPPEYCRLCGARAARIGHSSYDKSIIIERWDCAACTNSDFRHRKA